VPNLIDTHCHINFDAYDADRAAVIERAVAQGVSRIINPAVDLETGAAALALADEYPEVYAAVGIHPNDTADFDPAIIERIAEQASHPKVVAIGEIGLDYYWDKSPKEQQWRAFESQLALAARLNLPVIIHNREASDDVIAVLRTWVKNLPPEHTRIGVLHSFSAPRHVAESALELGFHLGFTGPVTYKNANDLRLVAAAAPLDRILVETDGPFLSPQGRRGSRNEPAYVVEVAERIATLHNIAPETFADATTRNAETLFGL
jgi:TatD DNase family protein